MQEQIEKLKGKIKADYIKWTTQGGKKELTGYFKESVDNFDDSMTVKAGKKYTKIMKAPKLRKINLKKYVKERNLK